MDLCFLIPDIDELVYQSVLVAETVVPKAVHIQCRFLGIFYSPTRSFATGVDVDVASTLFDDPPSLPRLG